MAGRSLAATLCGRKTKKKEETAEATVDTAVTLAKEKRARQQKELFGAIRNCDLASIKKLKEECYFKDIKDIHDRTPLHVLVDIEPDCDVDKVIKDMFDILTEGAHGCNINCVEKYGNTPIKLAAEKGCLQVLRCLLEKKADMNKPDKLKEDTPLHWSAKNNMCEATVLLVEHIGVGLNPQNKDKDTPLHLAVKEKHKDMVCILLCAGVDKMMKGKNNSTPLDIAEGNNSKDIIELLKKSKEDLIKDAMDKYGVRGQVEHGVRGQGEQVEADSDSARNTLPWKLMENKIIINFIVNLHGNSMAAIGPNARFVNTYATSEALASPTSTTPPTSPTRIVFPTAPLAEEEE